MARHRLWITIGAIAAAIILILLIAIPFLLNADNYRPRIESALSDATGRKVTLGHLSFSIFSGSLTADQLSTADDPAFSQQPFVQAKQVHIGIEVGPLLFHKQIMIRGITIDSLESGLDIHIAHLGTMGVYGYGTAGMKIPEGYLKVKVEVEGGRLVDNEILYPANPGSIYHMTKTQDQLLFFYYNKNDKVRVTDLHQGIVWGTQTEQTRMDDRLINRFDYDGDYGTVLNRFLMQAAVGYPLTVHGTGGQTRAFIHIQDTVRCIQLALENPPEAGERVQIFNQMTECHRVRDLAKMISDRTGVKIDYVPNPRNEADENELHVANDRFLHLGLEPITLNDGLMEEVTNITLKYAERCDRSKIPCVSLWNAKPLAGKKMPRTDTAAAE